MNRARLHHTEAIVLKRHDFGEADRILTLYTPDRGKQRAIAKGVRRIASRKAGHVELFVHAGVLLAEGRSLHVLTQADTIDSFRGLRDDLTRTSYAYHVAEILDRFVEEDMASPPTFQLLRGTFGALAAADQPSLVARYFEVRLLGLMGYRPELFHCASCRAELQSERNAFSPEAGGVVCPACRGRHADAEAIDDPTFRVLRFLQARDWSDVGRLSLTPATLGSLERIMVSYIHCLLERELKSIEFLRGMRHLDRAAARRPGGAPAEL